MENYKIKVNNEAESKEAQELFFELGYSWLLGKVEIKYIDEPSLIATLNGISFCGDMDHFHKFDAKELTLHQLRDLVVLHRNDVKDATHIDKYGTSHVDINGQWFFWSNNNDDEIIDYGWNESASSRESDNRALEPIKPIQEPGLISGADALRALADGKEVEQWNGNIWWDVEGNYQIDVFRCGKYKFRLKPRTIKLSIEIPAPFEPKDGEKAYRLAPAIASGYTEFDFDENDSECQFGAWRTEEEIKQVVEALRGEIKG